MKQISLPKYAELSLAFNHMHPSEAHGLLCGILCGNLSDSNAAWKEIVEREASNKSHVLLQTFYTMSVKQLAEFLFEFQLILPEDEQPLPQRAEALTLWCQGFLTGLKLTQIEVVDREPGEMTEAINDLIEIAKMNYEEVVASEEDESAYMELSEYVRMAVILIYQELHTSKTADKMGLKRLH